MRGGLKGATWEHDATITLDSKPTELYPVRYSIERIACFIV